jgi:hypothetical protein
MGWTFGRVLPVFVKRVQITCITSIFWHVVVLPVVHLVDTVEMCPSRIHKICKYKRSVFLIRAWFVSLTLP